MPQQPPPSPRQFKPGAGTGRALVAFIISIILMAVSIGYCIFSNNYLTQNYDRYINTIFGDVFMEFFDFPYSDFYDYREYGYDDEWGDYYDDEWGDYYDDEWGDYWDYEDSLTDEEIAIIDLVRYSSLPGFPEYTIEEVLLSRADEYGLSWDCYENDVLGENPKYYACATGYLDGSFMMIYAGFGVYEDGEIELFNLDDSERDEYYEDAVDFYAEWYDTLLSGSDKASSI
jgi:hypothetical protein